MNLRLIGSCFSVLLAAALLMGNGATKEALQGPPPAYQPFRLVAGYEYVNGSNTYINVSGNLVPPQGMHVISLVYQYETGYVTTASTTGGSTTGTTTGSTGQGQVVKGPVSGANPLVTTTGSTGSTTTTGSTTGGTGGGTGGNTSNGWYVFVTNGTGFGPDGGTPSQDYFPLAGNYHNNAALKLPIGPGSTVQIQYGQVGAININYIQNPNQNQGLANNLQITACIAQWVVTGGVGAWQNIQNLSSTVYKVSCPGSGIDSRLTYEDGDVIPSTANEGPRNLNFSSNIYRGGSFVGYLPLLTGDQSGVARTQLYPQASSFYTLNSVSLVFASVLHMGSPSYGASDLPVGLFLPAATDPNYSSTPGSVTWATQWAITPQASAPSPANYSLYPLSTQTLLVSGESGQGVPVGDYASFNATTVIDEQVLYNGQEMWSTQATTPSTVLDRFCLATQVESTFVTNQTAAWHWLEDSSYQGVATAFPYTDGAPRLWIVAASAL